MSSTRTETEAFPLLHVWRTVGLLRQTLVGWGIKEKAFSGRGDLSLWTLYPRTAFPSSRECPL